MFEIIEKMSIFLVLLHVKHVFLIMSDVQLHRTSGKSKLAQPHVALAGPECIMRMCYCRCLHCDFEDKKKKRLEDHLRQVHKERDIHLSKGTDGRGTAALVE